MLREMTLTIFIVVTAGCASTDRWLRPPSVSEPQAPAKDMFPAALQNKVTLRCVRLSDDRYTPAPESSDDLKAPCLYQIVQINAGPSPDITPGERDQFVDYLRYIADRNCNNFLSRAFANRSGMEASRNVVKDLATGMAAGTAYALPGVSAGLGFANLFGGTVVDSINSTYYLKETFPALESAVAAARYRQLDAIINKRTKNDGSKTTLAEYSFWEAITDIGKYGDLCSIDSAIAEMTANAATSSASEQKQVTNTQIRNKERQPQ